MSVPTVSPSSLRDIGLPDEPDSPVYVESELVMPNDRRLGGTEQTRPLATSLSMVNNVCGAECIREKRDCVAADERLGFCGTGTLPNTSAM